MRDNYGGYIIGEDLRDKAQSVLVNPGAVKRLGFATIKPKKSRCASAKSCHLP